MASASIAAPPMRARLTAALVCSAEPSRRDAVTEGRPSSARPAPVSIAAVKVSRIFTVIPACLTDEWRWRRMIPAPSLDFLPTLVARPGGRLTHLDLVRCTELHRPQVDGQLM